MREETGKTTKNARIKIDYTKTKPQVTFSYPNSKLQYGGSMLYWIAFLWSGISFLFYISLVNINNLVIDTKTDAILSTIFLLIALTMTIITYYPFKGYWKNFYPKFHGFIAIKKVATFRAKDVRQEKKLYYCELPVFCNVVLDYECTKDFSRYLNLFEIKEHNFKFTSSRIARLQKRLKNKQISPGKRDRIKKEIKKGQLNEWVWYARFYFSEKPKKGLIRVIYK